MQVDTLSNMWVTSESHASHIQMTLNRMHITSDLHTTRMHVTDFPIRSHEPSKNGRGLAGPSILFLVGNNLQKRQQTVVRVVIARQRPSCWIPDQIERSRWRQRDVPPPCRVCLQLYQVQKTTLSERDDFSRGFLECRMLETSNNLYFPLQDYPWQAR